MKDLKIWFATSEAAPFVKTGGLADVAGSLPKALKKLGADIRVVLPKYAQIADKYTKEMEFIGYTYVDLTWRRQYCGVFKLDHEGVTFYFIDNKFYFDREWYYGLYDDGERFAFFSKAILEVLPLIGFQPQLIHLNDWQTGLVSVLLDAHYRQYRNEGFFKNLHTLYTIHNLKYQGIFPKVIMDELLGLEWSHFLSGGISFYDQVNYMKAGLSYSSAISTVSRTYAEEIKSPFYGEQLDGVLRNRAADLYGIINGIDYDTDNPESDPKLYAPFSSSDLSGKYENKRRLQEDLGLEVNPDVPLISMISRLIDQKGFNLVARMMDELVGLGVQIAILGTGDFGYEEMFIQAQRRYPKTVSANIRYDGTLAQRMYAGSDMFLMPSLYEPCGLSQIFSMRYGTVPIVRETGGLKDTVIPYNVFTKEGTGFSFTNYNAHEMKGAVERALEVFKNKDEWENIVKTCMAQDFSWSNSAREYLALYEKIIGSN